MATARAEELEPVPHVNWKEMDRLIAEEIAYFRDELHSGMHISLIGTNRGGKTTLVTGGGNDNTRGILRHFENVLVLDTTGDPGSIKDFGKPLNKYGSIHGVRRLSVQGKMSMSTTIPMETKEKVYKAISRAAKQGNVAIFADEVRQLANPKFYGLSAALEHLWLFGAKQGTSLIGGTQEPVWVPGAFYSQAKLHLMFHMRDVMRLKRMAEIGGETKLLQHQIAQLNPRRGGEKYRFIAVFNGTGDIYTSKYDLPGRKNASNSGRGTERANPPDNSPDGATEKRVTIRREKRLTVHRG